MYSRTKSIIVSIGLLLSVPQGTSACELLDDRSLLQRIATNYKSGLTSDGKFHGLFVPAKRIVKTKRGIKEFDAFQVIDLTRSEKKEAPNEMFVVELIDNYASGASAHEVTVLAQEQGVVFYIVSDKCGNISNTIR